MSKQITVYKFAELSEEVQRELVDEWKEYPDLWIWECEWWESGQQFAKLIGFKLISADFANSNYSWEGFAEPAANAREWLEENNLMNRAREEVKGKCGLTGYYGDAPLFDPMSDCPEDWTMSDLIEACLESWVCAARDDFEYAYSDECIIEMIETFDRYYTKNGTEI